MEYDYLKKYNPKREHVTRKEVIHLLIPVSITLFMLILIFLTQTFFIPFMHRAVSYRKILKHSVEEGDVLFFGNNEWNNTWYVLKVEDSRILLINEKCVETMNSSGTVSNYDPHLGVYSMFYPYVPQGTVLAPYEDWKVSWEYSGLKNWLNNRYYNNAFNDNEKKLICDCGYGNVYLLSADDVRDYFGGSPGKITNIFNNSYPWWLRSSTEFESNPYNDYVSYDGRINGNGICYPGSNIGVRPAIWISYGK